MLLTLGSTHMKTNITRMNKMTANKIIVFLFCVPCFILAEHYGNPNSFRITDIEGGGDCQNHSSRTQKPGSPVEW